MLSHCPVTQQLSIRQEVRRRLVCVCVCVCTCVCDQDKSSRGLGSAREQGHKFPGGKQMKNVTVSILVAL